VKDRLTFCWKALRLGTRQLNAAAAWVGTIVLVLGFAGIVVPLVLHKPHWVIAVILLALLVLVVAEGSYQVWHRADEDRAAAEAERDSAKAEVARRFDAQRYALVFDSVHSITHPAPHHVWGTVELRLHIDNNSNDPLRFEIEDMSVTIDGQFSPPNAPLLNRGTVIAPHDTVQYLAPTVDQVRIPWQLGNLEVTVCYGPPTGPFLFRTARRWALRHFGVAGAPPGHGDQVSADLLGEPEVEDI
jgi:hypothetical protein